jgi:malonyl-CoA decarboxylase
LGGWSVSRNARDGGLLRRFSVAARATEVERAIEALRVLQIGDVSAREPAQTLVTAVAAATESELVRILRLLDALDVDAPRVARRLDAAAAVAADPVEHRAALAKLRVALEPARDRVLANVSAVNGSLRFVVDLRASVLALLEKRDDVADLAPLAEDLRAFLAARIDLGLLELRRLTWSDSAALLERLARLEAVHAVRGWFDLKDRLDDDRRIYAFFHPALPGSPLVFTEVALTDELAGSMRAIFNRDTPPVVAAQARCAIFYSISNGERGLTAIPFGNALIKHVVDTLRGEFPRLKTFATLSPMPGFAAWLRNAAVRVPAAVREGLAVPGWHRDPAVSAALREPLLRLAARYLLAAKRPDGAPLDPVERFHLANGAIAERLDWLADPTARGLAQSFGMMVNYRYALDRVAANQLAYAADRHVEGSSSIKALLGATGETDEDPAARAERTRRGSLLHALRTLASNAKRRIGLGPERD